MTYKDPEYQKKYQQRNKDRIKIQRQEYYQRNKETRAEKNRLSAIASRKNNPAKSMLVAARYRSKMRGISFNLEETDIVLPLTCPVLHIPLQCHAGKGNSMKNDSYSLDRIDPEKGYTKGNIQVISGLANRMKQNATPEELLLFAEWVFKTYKENI